MISDNLLEEIDNLQVKVELLEDKVKVFIRNKDVDINERWNVMFDFCGYFNSGFQLVTKFKNKEFQDFIDKFKKSNTEYFIIDIIQEFSDFAYEILEKNETEFKNLIDEIKEEFLQKFIYSFQILKE